MLDAIVDVDDYDGNCLMTVSKMENFIRSSTAHTAKCGGQLVLIKRDTSKGAYMRHIWKCRRCGGEFEQQNCDMVRSKEVARGAAYSMQQPDFNLRLVTASTLTGVNLQQVSEFMTGQMAVKIAADGNMRKQLEERGRKNNERLLVALFVGLLGTMHQSVKCLPIRNDGLTCQSLM